MHAHTHRAVEEVTMISAQMFCRSQTTSPAAFALWDGRQYRKSLRDRGMQEGQDCPYQWCQKFSERLWAMLTQWIDHVCKLIEALEEDYFEADNLSCDDERCTRAPSTKQVNFKLVDSWMDSIRLNPVSSKQERRWHASRFPESDQKATTRLWG